MATLKTFLLSGGDEFAAPLIEEVPTFFPPAIRPKAYVKDGLPDTFPVRTMLSDYRQAHKLLKRIYRWWYGSEESESFTDILPDLASFLGKDVPASGD